VKRAAWDSEVFEHWPWDEIGYRESYPREMVQLAPHALGIFSTIHGFMGRGVEEGDGRAIDPVAEDLPGNAPSSSTGMMRRCDEEGVMEKMVRVALDGESYELV
jgi:hypothetical protein